MCKNFVIVLALQFPVEMVIAQKNEKTLNENLGYFLEQALSREGIDQGLLEHLQTLRENAEAQQDRLLLLRTSLVLAKHYLAHHQYLETLQVLEPTRAYCYLLSIKEKKHYFLALAKSYLILNRFEPLIHQSVEWLKLATESMDVSYEVQVHSLLGSLHVALGALDTALNYFDHARQLVHTTSIQAPVHLLYALGRFYYAKDDPDNALYYFELALRRSRAEKDQEHQSLVLNNLGIYYGNQQDFKKAITYHIEALNIAKQAHDYVSMALTCNNIAVSLMDQKRFASAHRYLNLALKSHEKTPGASRESLIKGNLGEIAMLKGDYDTAQRLLLESLLLAEQSKDSRRLRERYEDLSMFYEYTGDFKNSLKYFKLFHQQKLQLVESSASARAMLLQNKFELDKLRQEQEIDRLKNIELSAVVRKLEQLSHQDGLTGLYNRRFFDESFQRNIEKHAYNGRPLALMLADIDNFKKINDEFSHTVGDEVLKIVAKVFMDSLRGSDVVARYGGEEIVALFPETTLENARRVCEKIRILIESYPWKNIHADLTVTISMGLSDNLTYAKEEMLVAADGKLYVAKRNGKNRVES